MLMGTKYDLHRAKKKIDAYFTARAKNPEFFAQRDPTSADIQQACRAMYVSRVRAPAGPRGTELAIRPRAS